MLALLVCTDRECRAAFEAEGSADAIEGLHCEDCGSHLCAVGWADAEPERDRHKGVPEVRRAA